jgi:hypothetical protein
MKFLEYVENRELEAFAYKVHLLDESRNKQYQVR